MKLFAPIESTQELNPGEISNLYNLGDFLLIKDHSLYSQLVQYGQELRFESPLTKFTHVAIVISKDGDIAEADGKQVSIAHASKYNNFSRILVRPALSDEERNQAMRFIQEAINESYGWMTIASIGLNFLTGSKFNFGLDGQEICSGLVARALEHAGFIFPVAAGNMCPAQLAMYFVT